MTSVFEATELIKTRTRTLQAGKEQFEGNTAEVHKIMKDIDKVSRDPLTLSSNAQINGHQINQQEAGSKQSKDVFPRAV